MKKLFIILSLFISVPSYGMQQCKQFLETYVFSCCCFPAYEIEKEKPKPFVVKVYVREKICNECTILIEHSASKKRLCYKKLWDQIEFIPYKPAKIPKLTIYTPSHEKSETPPPFFTNHTE